MVYQLRTEAESKNYFKQLWQNFLGDDSKKRALEYLQKWENKFWIDMDENIREVTKNTVLDSCAERVAELEF